MNTKKLLPVLLSSAALMAAGTLVADEIRCKNGTIIIGEITAIDDGVITVKNPSDDGGDSKIKQSEVLSVSTSKPVNVRTADGKTHTGTFTPTAVEGEIMIGGYKIITLCGSTKFKEDFMRVQKELSLQGNIVISVGLFGHSGDNEVWENMSEGELSKTKLMLDDMHKRKIDLADEIFVINKNWKGGNYQSWEC